MKKPRRIRNRPASATVAAPELVPTTATDRLSRAPLINSANSYDRTYRLGECTVIVTREFGKYHLSIAHHSRYPTWLEISAAWYKAIPGAEVRTAALVLPPLHEYVNLHRYCMQVLEIDPIPDHGIIENVTAAPDEATLIDN